MTPEEYLNRARALIPAIRERAPYMEQLRRLPDETCKEFQEAGLFRAIQPKRYGGYELDPGVFFQAGVEIGTVCGSSARCLTVVGVHNWQLGLFPPQAQEDVWHQDASVQSPRPWRQPGRWNVSMGASCYADAGHSRAAAIFANGLFSVVLSRPRKRTHRPMCAVFSCRVVTTASTTTGTSWACAALGVRTLWSRRRSCRSTAPCHTSIRFTSATLGQRSMCMPYGRTLATIPIKRP